jgi:cell division protease FtsH
MSQNDNRKNQNDNRNNNWRGVLSLIGWALLLTVIISYAGS